MSRHDALMALDFPEVEHGYTWRDTVLYALGVGAGAEPLDPFELRHVYEDDLAVIPSMAVTLAYPGFWYRNLPTGLDFVRTVHAAERFEIHHPLPAAASVVARPSIVSIHDKGEGRGALVVSRRDILRKADGLKLATVTQTAFCRGDGGLGGPIVAAPAPHALPDRAPDLTVEMPTSPRAALIYRLSGDDNPLHCDPAFAADASFPRPILHGLCSYGHVARAILRNFCTDGLELVMMDCRFTGVVYPGEALTVEFWQDGDALSFRAHAGGRKAIDNGEARLAPRPPIASAG